MKFLFYGGKGGVGKTTCAAARAVAAAAAGERVLVVSTDPAHSLGDALGVRLRDCPTPVRAAGRPERRRRGNLHGVELDAVRAFARWRSRHRRALADILEQGTWLDRLDVDALVGLPVPGVDELVGLVEIMCLSREHDADLVVIDTAPTGHTLRLLAAPETVAGVARALDALYETHRFVRERFTDAPRAEAADRLIALLEREAHDIEALLRDRRQTTVCWLTLPEAMSVAETEDALAALRAAAISVDEIIVNRVLPDAAPCALCDRIRAGQRKEIARIRGRLKGRRLRLVLAEIEEPQGIAALARIGHALIGNGVLRERRRPGGKLVVQQAHHERHGRGATRAATRLLDRVSDAQLLFVGGKGGVGKTTVASALALHLARLRPPRRVLLLSTDPAHSLGDAIGAPVGDVAAPVAGAPRRLHVREIDAVRALELRSAELESALDDAASNFVNAAAGEGGPAAELLRLAPPGIDELFGMLSIVDARKRYDAIVVDTAPTGHALRLLETPDAIRAWVQVLLRVLVKYRAVVRPGRFAARVVELSRTIRELQSLIHDPCGTAFVVVTRAAELPRVETERLVSRLRRMKLAVPAIVVNAMTLAPNPCARCRSTAAAERRQLEALMHGPTARRRGCVIIQTPLVAPPPRGPRALEQWARQWQVVGT